MKRHFGVLLLILLLLLFVLSKVSVESTKPAGVEQAQQEEATRLTKDM